MNQVKYYRLIPVFNLPSDADDGMVLVNQGFLNCRVCRTTIDSMGMTDAICLDCAKPKTTRSNDREGT